MNSYITSSDYECTSDISLKTFVVSLTNGDKKTVRAESIDADDCGALTGVQFNGRRIDADNCMSPEVLWSFAPGTWLYVERVKDQEEALSRE